MTEGMDVSLSSHKMLRESCSLQLILLLEREGKENCGREKKVFARRNKESALSNNCY